LGHISKRGIAGSLGVLYLIFSDTTIVFIHSGYTRNSQKECIRVVISSHPCQHFYFLGDGISLLPRQEYTGYSQMQSHSLVLCVDSHPAQHTTIPDF
jgi:hypothetical protein